MTTRFFVRLAFWLLRKNGYHLIDVVDSWKTVLGEENAAESVDSRERYLSRFLLQNRLRQTLERANVSLAIDVGANRGDFATTLRRIGFRQQILSIEPNPRVHEILARRAENDTHWATACCAVGEKEGTATLHISNDTSFSSLHARTEKSSEIFGQLSESQESIEVPLRRLDHLVRERSFSQHTSVLLKSDTQGHDRNVCESYGDLLSTVNVLLVEMPIVALYESGGNFSDLYQYYTSRGFVLNGVYPVSWSEADDTLLEVDALFVRVKQSRS